jgi:hypothetical protein
MGGSFDMRMVPAAANMPPTPWQTEILAASIWGGWGRASGAAARAATCHCTSRSKARSWLRTCRDVANVEYIAFDGKSSPDTARAATPVNGSGGDDAR